MQPQFLRVKSQTGREMFCVTDFHFSVVSLRYCIKHHLCSWKNSLCAAAAALMAGAPGVTGASPLLSSCCSPLARRRWVLGFSGQQRALLGPAGGEAAAGPAGRQDAGLRGKAHALPEGPRPPTLSCLKGKLGFEASCQM